MADPQKLDVGDWAAVVALVSAGVGSVMAWFRRGNQSRDARISLLEGTVYGGPGQAGHETQLAVIRTCQENTNRNLEELKDTTKDTNEKVSELSERLMDVLVELKRK